MLKMHRENFPKQMCYLIKARDIISHGILLDAYTADGLDVRTVHLVKNWLNGQDKEWRMELNPDSTSRGAPQSPILGLVLFNVFITYLDERNK